MNDCSNVVYHFLHLKNY